MTRGLRNKRTSGDNPNYRITEMGQNTEKSPVGLRRRCHSHYSERSSANVDVKN